MRCIRGFEFIHDAADQGACASDHSLQLTGMRSICSTLTVT